MLRETTFLALVLLFPILLSAQPPGERSERSGDQPPPSLITGQVLDQATNLPVEYATVALIDTLNNQVIDGTTTDTDGKFTIRARGKSPVIEISFMGYKPFRITDIKFVQGKADLGTIKLNSDAAVLDEVVVRAEKSSTEFRLDKRVFNVGQDLSSTGASALEVLNNVPSVNVDIEGAITLRGSGGVQVLIDGRPSVLADEGNALGTITAEMMRSMLSFCAIYLDFSNSFEWKKPLLVDRRRFFGNPPLGVTFFN